MVRSRATLVAGLIGLCLVGVVGLGIIGSAGADTGGDASVSEEAYVEPAPEQGELYYEASDPDGNWVSYINPRDEYRYPDLGDASGKLCVTLLNEAGDPIVGETVPDTTVTVPTGEELEWHSSADPMTVEYPVTENYDRPLDADQFGTTDDLPQGDGYMDSHCIEMHNQPEDATIEYGEAQIDGEHADDIEVVGYIQQAHDSWDSDVDPIEDAESYEEAGGGWTFQPEHSHGQAVIVLQLDRDGYDGGVDDPENGSSDDGETASNETDSAEPEIESESGESDDDDGDDEMPGFGVAAALAALTAAVLVARRRSG
ncbi:PGF-CTERM sorting domain-containing protein [Natronolimnohabitans innermongolicus]|uniref:PGF-CTERM archaeal protein-sorting signal domain-containing protein n=1 Tax=Natronolimnohabitans innermongolicus JCM 12255 TaxID=1227499 RepID=L9WI02_9EURY|nr:PGF-CTERM sorting domain-containing protein [Natronolimnohabitans innermongolicus]ELY48871.1 hypothetical protein C493_21326 [Natronolimnohabitans innermongolicus JCM 12255]